MMTSSNGNVFRVIGPLCGEFTGHRSPVNSPHKGQWRGALMFSLICACKRLSKQPLAWWFETPSRPLWRHYNGLINLYLLLLWRPSSVGVGVCGLHVSLNTIAHANYKLIFKTKLLQIYSQIAILMPPECDRVTTKVVCVLMSHVN